MNWWSAASWCKSNSMRLPKMYEICPDWDGNTGRKCPELDSTGDGLVWTATASGSEHAFAVRLSNGYISVGYNDGIRHNTYSAFCR